MVDLSKNPRARSFASVGADGRGCLLIHGLTGTPDELRPLGDELARRGWSVTAPLLPGHGTRVEDLRETTWNDWFESVTAAWDELAANAPRGRFVTGLSMGALLALHLARVRAGEVRAVAALAPALELRNQKRMERALWLDRLPWLPRSIAIVPKGATRRESPAYDRITIGAVAALVRLQRIVRAELGTIRVPVLLVEGGRDDSVSPAAVPFIEGALGSQRKERQTLPEATHIVTEGDVGRDVVRKVVAFFEKSDHPTGSGFYPMP